MQAAGLAAPQSALYAVLTIPPRPQVTQSVCAARQLLAVVPLGGFDQDTQGRAAITQIAYSAGLFGGKKKKQQQQVTGRVAG